MKEKIQQMKTEKERLSDKLIVSLSVFFSSPFLGQRKSNISPPTPTDLSYELLV